MLAAVIAVFLAMELALFVPAVQIRLKSWFRGTPSRIFLVPAVLTAVFAAILWHTNGWSWPFLGLAAVYSLVPTTLVYANGSGVKGRPWLDFAAILLLWLPVEFTTGKQWLPQRSWSLVNIAGHGTAVALGLFLFLVFRDWKGVKYNLPRKASDLLNPAIGFLIAAPVLIFLGLRLGFLGPFRLPESFSAGAFGLLFLKTLLGVAIPEELLFRGLIQNWIMQNFGFNHRSLLAAAVVFGSAHLNNASFPAPNWRYFILATIAGFIYGKVFWKSSTLLSSAGLHAFVNALRHTLFA